MKSSELKQLHRDLKKIREATDRLFCQSVALIHVLKNSPGGDGQPVLSPERWQMYQERLAVELNAKGLD
jgi:hypothetical protein